MRPNSCSFALEGETVEKRNVKELAIANILTWTSVIALSAAVFLGASCEQARLAALDNNDVFAPPENTPWMMVASQSSGITDATLQRSIDQWNTWASEHYPQCEREWFRICNPEDNCRQHARGVLYVTLGYHDITVEEYNGYVLPRYTLGLFTYILIGGQIVSGTISLSADWPYDSGVLEHEMGHAMGLRDDPWSVDSGSLMADPYIPGGRPTKRDLEAIVERLEDYCE